MNQRRYVLHEIILGIFWVESPQEYWLSGRYGGQSLENTIWKKMLMFSLCKYMNIVNWL